MEEKEVKHILVFAHRGASKDYPENTMFSFKKANKLNVDFIETDLHFTRDERFAVIHDDFIDRTTDGKGKVAGFTMNELKKFDAGYYFSRDGGRSYPFRGSGISIMSLEEMLETFPSQKFNIDLKDKNIRQIWHFTEIIERYNAADRIIVGSIYYKNLKELRRIFPDIRTSFSSIEVLAAYSLYKCGFLFLNLSFKGIAFQLPEMMGQIKLVTRSFVKEVHTIGLDVHVWTVNAEEDIRRFIDMGVDGIMTDDPELLIKVLGENRNA